VPLVAIGGITSKNADEVIEAGADAVAVISAIGAAADPEAATRRLLEQLTDAAKRRPAH
jgi:thiamine-phosphate pyrophosphorylase